MAHCILLLHFNFITNAVFTTSSWVNRHPDEQMPNFHFLYEIKRPMITKFRNYHFRNHDRTPIKNTFLLIQEIKKVQGSIKSKQTKRQNFRKSIQLQSVCWIYGREVMKNLSSLEILLLTFKEHYFNESAVTQNWKSNYVWKAAKNDVRSNAAPAPLV